MEFVPKERALPIRMPSTANLMIDSEDRASGLPNDFTITKLNSILNGFFTRISTTELVLEWLTPNINGTEGIKNNIIGVSLNGGAVTNYQAPPSFYTQAQLLDWLAEQLSIITAPTTWSIVLSTPSVTASGGVALLVPSAPVDIVLSGPIADLLNLELAGPQPVNNNANPYFSVAGDLRLYRYIDFVSSQLTNNQSLKDASTAPIVRDVLARWYFAYDNPPALDAYGFPILMGYTPFVLRRTFSPPKEIRWETNIPVGQLSFQVYQPNGELAEFDTGSGWLMTLQVSEV